ncbi:hypothetical protein RRG08_007508 [Elysia crispata]|uniref:Uncharacterized protein n=1 Tax=Elysia crispata TaxID=231223 RepID=A0AAE1DEZ5_9GAST|nr:hypothetical protein RRG08_007508 [Elysia crispata]
MSPATNQTKVKATSCVSGSSPPHGRVSRIIKAYPTQTDFHPWSVVGPDRLTSSKLRSRSQTCEFLATLVRRFISNDGHCLMRFLGTIARYPDLCTADQCERPLRAGPLALHVMRSRISHQPEQT